MANREKGEIPLVVGGISYTFVLNTGAMIAAETEASRLWKKDVCWDDLVVKLPRGGVQAFAIYMWAGLQKYHPTLTVDAVLEIIDECGGLNGLYDTFMKTAHESSLPDPADLAELPPPPKAQTRAPRGDGVGARSTSKRARRG